MKKFEKKDYINVIIFSLIILIYVCFVTKFFEDIYGSTVDWDCQHWEFPEYFRTLFYKTKQLVPSFAFNIGGGQNIFYFSYYGLLGPIILLSYLFPFVRMVDYIQISSIMCSLISTVLIYKWLLNKYDRKNAFLCALIFMIATPVLYHSHRHIMFVNYLPFAIMGLMGVDEYFDKGRKSLLALSIFLTIMTNYFYSVGMIVSIVIYGIYKYLEKNGKTTFINFIKEGFCFIIPIVIGILMAGIILLPTIYVLLNGRSDSTVSINFFNLLIPTFEISSIYYSPYSPGMISIFLFSLVFCVFSKKRENRILGIILALLIIFPIFIFLLNGMMYVDYKVLIPFVPLFVFAISKMIEAIEKKKYDYKKNYYIVLGISIMFIMYSSEKLVYLFIIDVLITGLIILLNKKYENKYIIYFLLIVIIGAYITTSVYTDNLYSRNALKEFLDKNDQSVISELLDKDTNIYRSVNENDLLHNINRVGNINFYNSSVYSSTSNKSFKDFYYNAAGVEITQRSYAKLTGSKNIFYNMYMGNKYMIDDGYSIVGYNKVKDKVYENNNVLPIGYSSNKLMSKKEFETLSYPYNMEALLKYIIVDDDSIISGYKTNITEEKIDFDIVDKKNVKIKKENNIYYINSNDGEINLKINNIDMDDILIIEFKMKKEQDCKNGDQAITINGIKNVLTCSGWKYHNKNYEFKYVISSNELTNNLSIVLTKGEYEIADIKTYAISYSEINNIRNNVNELFFDKNKTQGDIATGHIDVENDGYLYLSIPYDKGFDIKLNGNSVDYEIVDNGFIGTKVKKGQYLFEMKYTSPFLNTGYLVSTLGLLSFFAILFYDFKKNKKKKKTC